MGLRLYARCLAFTVFFIASSLLSLTFILCPGAILFLLLKKVRLYQRWNSYWLGSFMTLLVVSAFLCAGEIYYFVFQLLHKKKE